MRRSGLIWGFVSGVSIAGLALGLAHLFRLRFEVGDVYPPYSSLRADPLGLRGLHDSFVESPRHRVRRNFGPLRELKGASESTVFRLGAGREAWMLATEEDYEAAEDFVRQGGRLVLGFASSKAGLGAGAPALGGRNAPAPPVGARGRGGGRTSSPSGGASGVSMMERWGFSLDVLERDGATNRWTAYRADNVEPESGLTESMPWRSSIVLRGLSETWRTVYEVGDEAVVVERDLGKGGVVVCADSYLFSNEALRKEPQAAFLLWAVGDALRVVFDETHLGVREEAGVAALGRRYRLHGLLVGLVVLGALWVWRAMLPLVPPGTDETRLHRDEIMVGRDAASGLAALLRRHVPPSELLETCVGEWRRSFPAEARRLGERADQLTTVVVRERNLQPRERRANQPAAYRELRDLIEPRRSKRRSEMVPE